MGSVLGEGVASDGNALLEGVAMKLLRERAGDGTILGEGVADVGRVLVVDVSKGFSESKPALAMFWAKA